MTALACLVAITDPTPARAEGPGEGTPTVVSLGDSYISGEAGRWAGNTNESSSKIDALGETAYYDNSGHTAELIPGCHRSQSAEVYIGGGVGGENLACSGAKTASFTNSEGGCGFWNADANWANEHALPTIDESVFKGAEKTGLTNIKYMQLSSAFNGRRLCEKGVGLLEEEGLSSWKSAGAVDKTEWINQVRTVSALSPPYELQEDLHPNYWAQLALRNCLTQAYNSGTPKSGTCTISTTGLNAAGEPNMSLK